MRIAPVFEDLARQNPDVRFLKVDAEVHRDLTVIADISAYPTFLVFTPVRGGRRGLNPQYRLEGADRQELSSLRGPERRSTS